VWPTAVPEAKLAPELVEVLEDRVVTLAIVLERVWICADLLGDVLHHARGDLGHVGQRTARKSEQPELNREAQAIGGATMTINDLEVACRERVEPAEVTFGQVGGDAYEGLTLLGGQQPWRLGYHPARSAPAGIRTGNGMGLANLSQ
jgi:hypothetical protein